MHFVRPVSSLKAVNAIGELIVTNEHHNNICFFKVLKTLQGLLLFTDVI